MMMNIRQPQDAMKLLYVTAGSPSKKLVHYSAAEDAPWLWYETSDASKVPAKGGHGTDMFKIHPDLPNIIVHWFVTTLKNTGSCGCGWFGSSVVNPVSSLQTPDGEITQQLLELGVKIQPSYGWKLRWTLSAKIISVSEISDRHLDLQAQCFGLSGFCLWRSLILLEPICKQRQRQMKRHTPKGLLFLDSHRSPASSWADTEQRRGEIRSDVEKILKQLTSDHNPGAES